MAFCTECGAQISDSATLCPHCGAVQIDYYTQSNTNASGNTTQNYQQQPNYYQNQGYSASGNQNGQPQYGSPYGQYGNNMGGNSSAYNGNTQGYSRNNETPSFVLADGEQIVKRYRCCESKRLFKPSCQGYLYVTNKRVIFSGYGKENNFIPGVNPLNSRVCNEVLLSSVSGMKTSYGTNVSFALVLFGILFFIGGFVLLLNRYMPSDLKTLGFLIVVIGGLMLYLSRRKNFQLKIFSNAANGSPINVGEGAISVKGNSAIFTLNSLPTEETDRMINELGALVQDLQTKGDYAIEKWQK